MKDYLKNKNKNSFLNIHITDFFFFQQQQQKDGNIPSNYFQDMKGRNVQQPE